ncbi:MAG TPA: vWA domain-containing protein [Gammaproteobacteria bacterium]|nr:vWA domain-containing protein [Gammaproteobacteria bacterium]
MKTKILALVLLLATGFAVAFYKTGPDGTIVGTQFLLPGERPEIEVVFVLDTTGSMGGLIEAAKEKIWSIASTMTSAQPAPLIRMGLVAYRDRDDQYVTRVIDLSEDLDSVYASLMDLQADGGGDAPESVNQALYEAVHSISWSQNSKSYRAIFLVGDAPPHMDYQDDVKYPQIIAEAANRGIVINAVQCGSEPETLGVWRQIAQLGDGAYFQVGQEGSAVAISTPFDQKLAELAAELDGTRLYYGTDADKLKQKVRLDASAKAQEGASSAALARRGAFNASPAGERNFLGKSELVDDVASGRVELSKIDSALLPESLQPLAPSEREAAVAAQVKKRAALKRGIKELSAQRKDYLQAQVEATGGAAASLDEKIYEAVRSQAAKKGFEYKSATADY